MNGGRQDIQESEGEDDKDGVFGARVHTQIPDKGDGEEAEDPVRDSADGSVCIGDTGESRFADAIASSILDKVVPEEMNRRALEQKEEEVRRAENANQCECDVDQVELVPLIRETKKVHAN